MSVDSLYINFKMHYFWSALPVSRFVVRAFTGDVLFTLLAKAKRK